MKNKGEILLGIIAIVIFASIMVALIPSCDGGTIVRGLYWYECIGGK